MFAKMQRSLLLLFVVCSVLGIQPPQDSVHPAFNNPMGYMYHHHMAQGKSWQEGEEVAEGEAPLVTVDGLGRAKGKLINTFEGQYVSAFQGIPFAHQPQRFKYSEIYNDTTWLESETDVYDATYFRDRCPQASLVFAGIVSGSEDCLYLNVYTPYMNFTEEVPADLPVMVFIHGGAYLGGEATYYIPSRLMDRDVVVVVIQYRLGTLGFLYSDSDDAPGNMGLMDQVIALRWVNQFIHNFGGDPELVTVFGQSAGGASTSWMQVTPLTNADNNNGKELAQRFIPMSGSALEYWTLDRDYENSFIRQVEETGCDTSGSKEEMIDCMTNDKTLDEIVLAALKVYQDDRHVGGLGFLGQCPVVQSSAVTEPKVIAENPYVSVTEGRFLKKPLMTGSTRDDGSLVVGLLYKDYIMFNKLENDTEFFRDDLLPLVAQAFGIYDTTNSVANSFRLGYFPRDVEMGDWDQMSGPLVDLGGTMFLKSGLWTLTHLISQYNDTEAYFYSFEFESQNTLFDWIFFGSDMPIVGGVTHGDDLMYLFGMPSHFDDREALMVHKMTTLYTNFAKYGNPTPDDVAEEEGQWPQFAEKWRPYNADEKPFMVLGDDITLHYDFPLRWNYNKYGYNTTDNKVEPEDQRQQETGTGEEHESNRLLAGIVGGVCACAVVAVAAVALATNAKKKKTSLHSRGEDNIAMT